MRLIEPATRAPLGTRLIDAGSGYNAQSILPAHFGLASPAPVDVEVAVVTPGGRRVVDIAGVDPARFAGRALVLRIDGQGRLTRDPR